MLIVLGLIGILIGLASGFFGMGGGVILVPTLIYLGYDIKIAIGISVMQMIFSSMFGSYINYKAGALQLKSGFFLGLGALLGAAMSGPIVSYLPGRVLLIMLAMILSLSIYKFFMAPLEPKNKPNNSKVVLAIVGMVIGMVGISTGTGGAVFLTPVLVGFLDWDMKKAVGTTLFFVIFGSISGFISLSLSGHVDYDAGVAVGIGSLLSVYFGTKLSHRVSYHVQKKALLILYVFMFLLTLNKIFYS